MTLLTLAAKNLRHHARSYAAFFLSSAFAVWLFYLYAMLLFHPATQTGSIPDPIQKLLVAVEIVVALFSVLFMLYAYGAFQKVRQRERGLLTLLGITPRHLGRSLVYENALLGLGATTVGILLGTICAKLFFLGIGPLMGIQQRLPFHFSVTALLLTLGVFGGVYGLISLLTWRSLTRDTVAELFQHSRAAKAPPRFSYWLVLLAIACLGIAYGYGMTLPLSELAGWFKIMIVLLLGGTYLIFTQGSVGLLTWLQKRPSLYWHRTRLFALSRLVFKVRENAVLLFMVSILSALSLVMVSYCYGGLSMAAHDAQLFYPVPVSLRGPVPGVGPDRVTAVLREHGVPVTAAAQVRMLRVYDLREGRPGEPITDAKGAVQLPEWSLLPWSEANRWTTEILGRQALPSVEAGALEIVPDADPNGPIVRELTAGPGAPTATVTTQIHLDAYLLNGVNRVIVVDDAEFDHLQQQWGPAALQTVHGWGVADFTKAGPAVTQLKGEVEQAIPALKGSKRPGPLTASWFFLENQKLTFGLLFFLAVFMGLLFFLAAGNMLYFKMFTDLEQDRAQFQSLFKLGLSASGVRHIVTSELRVIFFAPMLVALLHATLMPLMVAKTVDFATWRSVLVVMAGYLVLQTGYYLMTRRSYVRAVLERGGVA